MPHISLTQLGAERLRAADIYWDKNLPGFGLRVSPKGRNTFSCSTAFARRMGHSRSVRKHSALWTTSALLKLATEHAPPRPKRLPVLIRLARNARRQPQQRLSARPPSSPSRSSLSVT